MNADGVFLGVRDSGREEEVKKFQGWRVGDLRDLGPAMVPGSGRTSQTPGRMFAKYFECLYSLLSLFCLQESLRKHHFNAQISMRSKERKKKEKKEKKNRQTTSRDRTIWV